MKRVLMVHPSAELYGSDRMFLESVIALGGRVVVALPQDGPLVAELRRHGATVVFCPTPVLRKAALRPAGFVRLLADAVRSLAPMIRLLRERPALVYVSTVTVPLWPSLARVFRRKVLVHVHEAEDGVPAAVRFALAAPLLAAHTVVVNSEATTELVKGSIPRLERKIQLVYNGVAGPPENDRRGEPHDPVRIVLVGRISPRKGTDLAVDAIARLRKDGHRVTLDLVGSVFPGYEWFEDRIRQQIRTHNLEETVRIRGFNADVWSAYRNADIALVPSRVEPFGNTAVEAQLAGVPVMVTDVQGLPETVDHGHWGAVVPPDDPASIAEAIATMLKDWPATVHRAEGARENARSRFAPERYRARIAELAMVTVKFH